MHNGQRPYSCNRCNLSFTQFVHLKLHARIHNNERPFTCIQCGRNYISLSGLRTHWKNTGCKSSSTEVGDKLSVLQTYVNGLAAVAAAVSTANDDETRKYDKNDNQENLNNNIEHDVIMADDDKPILTKSISAVEILSLTRPLSSNENCSDLQLTLKKDNDKKKFIQNYTVDDNDNDDDDEVERKLYIMEYQSSSNDEMEISNQIEHDEQKPIVKESTVRFESS